MDKAELPADIVALAQQVFKATESPDRAVTCNYYMVSINHPVIIKLKHRFCQKYGINPNHPMSDVERTAFELMLFKPHVLQMIAAEFTKKTEVGESKDFENSIKKE